jgi:hypothetical protein
MKRKKKIVTFVTAINGNLSALTGKLNKEAF